MNENQRDGKLLLVIGLATIPLWFLLSSGYKPNDGFISNIMNSMYIYWGEHFCHRDSSTNWSEECTIVNISLKHTIIGSLVMATYGYLILAQLAWNPIAALRAHFKK